MMLTGMTRSRQHMRLEKEMKTLIPKLKHLGFAINAEWTECTWTMNGRHYSLRIGDSYPFKAPIVFENGSLYLKRQNIFQHLPRFLSDRYRRINPKRPCPCTCCYSVLNSDRWSPAFTIEQIVEEIFTDHARGQKILSDYVQIDCGLVTRLPLDICGIIVSYL